MRGESTPLCCLERSTRDSVDCLGWYKLEDDEESVKFFDGFENYVGWSASSDDPNILTSLKNKGLDITFLLLWMQELQNFCGN